MVVVGCAAKIKSACHGTNNRKPHAVIAKGATLQRVPHLLRYLQKACRENGVPMFVLYDPRNWGGNTHSDLSDAMRDLRQTLKHGMVQAAYQQHQPQQKPYYFDLFRQGRWIGALETDAKWCAKDFFRRTKEAMKRADESEKWKQKELDWHNVADDEEAFERKLVRRGIIQQQQNNGEGVVYAHAYSHSR
jgi:hypothetical protein